MKKVKRMMSFFAAMALVVSSAVAVEVPASKAVTRGEMVEWLYQANGELKTATKTSFVDVPAGSEYADAAQWAKSNGLFAEEARMWPRAKMSKEEVVGLLYQYEKAVNGIPSDCTNAMEWAAVAGLMDENEDILCLATEAESKTMLERLMMNKNRCAEVAVTIYTAKDNTFIETDCEAKVEAKAYQDETYYSFQMVYQMLFDSAATLTQEESCFTKTASGDEVAYWTTKVENNRVEFHDNYILKGNDSFSVSDASFVINNDGALYLSKEALFFIFRNVWVNEDETLSILKNGVYPKNVRGSALTEEQRKDVTNAQWLLFNAYPQGFDIVAKNVRAFAVVNEEKAIERTNQTGVLGFATPGKATVYLVDRCFKMDETTLAAIIVHEATHYQQYKMGDYSENQTVLEEGIATYWLSEYHVGNSASFLASMLSNQRQDCYKQGYDNFRNWYAKQMAQ